MARLLLVGNPSHPGIRAVASGYRKAFESLGVDFHFYDFQERPMLSPGQVNMIFMDEIQNSYKKIVIIQPSWFTFNTMLRLQKMDDIEMYSINTEDPYSTSTMFQLNHAFKKIFSNEKLVAEKFADVGWEYLPVAFDSLAPFAKPKERTSCVTLLVSYYKNRWHYVEKVKQLDCTKFIGGSVAPLLIGDVRDVDLTGFTTQPNLLPRHKELELFSNSRIVLNPYRSVNHLGKSFLQVTDGAECDKMFNSAVSPNPRFFDAIACGAYVLNDRERTECFEIIKRHKVNPNDAFTLPTMDEFEQTIYKMLRPSDAKKQIIQDLAGIFREKETYVERAKFVLDKIGY